MLKIDGLLLDLIQFVVRLIKKRALYLNFGYLNLG